ncbi:MAG TPA: class I SAM-dependent methyltransferase [Candidatus Acidoferrum sp.]|nr:class I SAM-dependent methyltransferase [Candidatus Acidoferrum sp.]
MEVPGSDRPDTGCLEAIRRDWDARAKEDARHYINWPDIPNDEGAFFESGRVDYRRFVLAFFRRMGFEPPGKAALEIGCGIGRIARWMAQDFATYMGVDVSPEMVRKASEYAIPNATFRTVSGADLSGIASASVDFVFSFAVFQHVPDKAAILNYFSETARVLRPGGVFRLQMKGLSALKFGTTAIEAGLTEKRFGGMRLPFVRVRRLDTWQGRSIAPGEAIRECTSRGLKVEDVEGRWTVMMWVGGRKSEPQ